jgi:dCTP deaminase
MLLKGDVIATLLKKGMNPRVHDPLVVTPSPNLKDLRDSGAASLDLRLGTWFMALRSARMTHLAVGGATPAVQLTKLHYVRFGDAYYLHPRNFVLGVTLEWLRLPTDLAAYIVGKSGWGRRGLVIATASAVHPGFKGCLTLELHNVGEIPIEIRPGMTVCQMCLHRVDKVGKQADRSRYVGLRQPIVGEVEPDRFASKLFEAK